MKVSGPVNVQDGKNPFYYELCVRGKASHSFEDQDKVSIVSKRQLSSTFREMAYFHIFVLDVRIWCR